MADDGIRISLQGDDDVIEAFKQLAADVSNVFTRRAVRDAANRMRVEILTRVPILTGRLFNNIVVRVKRTAQTVRARVTINTSGKGDDPSNAFYWRFVEFGHKIRGGTGARAQPHPFVTPAFEAGKEEAAQDVVDAVGDAIKKAEARANRRAVTAARYL